MINVLFYHANNPENSENNRAYLNTAALYLKTYLDINHPEEALQVNWLLPQQDSLEDADLVKLCNDNNVTLLCTSHYIWSNDILIPQLKRIRDQISATVVAGGPSISVHVEDDFFEKYPFIDYAVYGAGEKAFADIIISLVHEKKLIAFNCSNLAYLDKERNKTVLTKYEYVPVLNKSPFVSNRELFTAMVRQIQDRGLEVALPFAMTRGCPYACTFCDWNAGLSNKVSRTKAGYKADIDLFAELKINVLYLADANVGQYDDDIAMIEYMGRMNLEKRANFKVEGNLSKLKKENNLKIMHLMVNGELIDRFGLIISVQDINKQVLDNIDRPDVTWEVHRAMIRELASFYPYYVAKLQLIQGLPGQTLESWRDTLRTVTKERVIAYIFTNEVLPTSPAALDPTYQERFQFTYSHALRFTKRKQKHQTYRGTFPASCVSFTQEEFVKMNMLSQVYLLAMVLRVFFDDFENIDVEYIVDTVTATENFKRLEKNLYNNWINGDKFIYTINFDSEQDLVPGDAMIEHIKSWLPSRDMQRILARAMGTTELQKRLFQTIKQSNFTVIDSFLNNYY